MIKCVNMYSKAVSTFWYVSIGSDEPNYTRLLQFVVLFESSFDIQ